MTQSTHPQAHDLTALAYALVPSPERETLLEHLAECDACREVYDFAFEEQADVRAVLLEESRSGEAEARALDRVLQSLKTLSAPVEQSSGKLYSLPRPAFYALEIAAALLIAAGVFYVAVLMPSSQVPPTDVASSASGGTLANPDVTAATEKTPFARVDSGSAMVAMDPEQKNWTSAREIPLNVWARNDSESPVVLTYANTSLNFKSGACFKLQSDPVNHEQIAVFILRGEANLTANNLRSLRILTNNADFVAAPGASFEIECDAVFNLANYNRRGQDVPQSMGQALTRASVDNGNVLMVPVGKVWEAPQLGLLGRGQRVELHAVERPQFRDGATRNVRLIKAESAALSSDQSAELDEFLGLLDADSGRQLKGLVAELTNERLKLVENGRSVVQRIVIEDRVYLHEGEQVTITDPKRSITLTIDAKNDLVAKVTVNGESRAYRHATLEELLKERPELADLLAVAKIKRTQNDKRRVVLQIGQQLESEQKQQQKEAAPQESK